MIGDKPWVSSIRGHDARRGVSEETRPVIYRKIHAREIRFTQETGREREACSLEISRGVEHAVMVIDRGLVDGPTYLVEKAGGGEKE